MLLYAKQMPFCALQDARALFMGLMYEIPSFGRHYFVAIAMDTTVAVGIGADGVQFLDATDPDRNLLGQYPFSDIDSFVIVSEVTVFGGMRVGASPREKLDRLWKGSLKSSSSSTTELDSNQDQM